ncbi:glucosamine-6-phosphate deaminase [Aliibacillus thermotolerans]|uniref:Glucosamine-6-phosphate deaminase n=1 Tax=Aliibacillus thermotolerans TaxID=1834418 RepID=A0ABW0U4I2_9BACI|nr:glucosamine-6-phosphate deaminase [Aliibacillus thermotolerans]MDA3130882.1 glucosamine-6-phosphate deaminase [Aliibacillus thermotolerans]
MHIIKVKNDRELSDKASDFLLEEIKRNPKAVLGLATGSTPEGTYRELIKKIKKEKLDVSQLTTINLDEYVGLSEDHPSSYHAYMNHHLFKPLGLTKEQTHIPKGDAPDLEAETKRFERIIQECGGIDFQLLGIGENGHIGFNEPGTSFDSRTQVVDLKPSTIEVNSRFFDNKEEMPRRALTLGIASIMESRRILLLASGERKQPAMKRLIEGPVDEQFPASVLKNHPHFTLIADEAALSGVLIDEMNQTKI